MSVDAPHSVDCYVYAPKVILEKIHPVNTVVGGQRKVT